MTETTWQKFVEHLKAEPLRHIASLRHALLFKDTATYWRLPEADNCIIHFPTALSRSDRQDYPETQTVSILSSPEGMEELRSVLGRGRHILKVNGELDESWLVPARQFLGLTSTRSGAALGPGLRVEVADEVPPAAVGLFEQALWSRAEIEGLLKKSAKLLSLHQDGRLVSACVLHPVFDGIWEIGALGTRPESQGQGLATALVGAARDLCLKNRWTVRYHVDATNSASVRVAEKAGFERFMTFRHYRMET